MTLAKKAFYLSSAVVLAGAMGVAQTGTTTPQDQDNPRAGQAAGAQLRGCLSGSAGNYTLTDYSGTIYHLVGAESQLQGSVGHEVEITGTPDAQRSSASDDMASNTASSFQVTGAREVAGSCTQGSRTGATSPDSHPMSERPPMTDQQPKGAPGEATPAPEPQPHLMAMLQQPGATDPSSTASQTSSTTSTTTTTTNTQTPASNSSNGSMANTPVTSQTPAETTPATGSNSQLGSGTTNPSAVGTQPAQSNTTATPSTGTTATTPSTAVSPDTGANATSGATTATPDASASPSATTNPSATATPGTAASPQSNQNDQNNPLYERQATDVPWASHSGSTTTTTSTTPDGSSSTTTTTNPQTTQPEPHL